MSQERSNAIAATMSDIAKTMDNDVSEVSLAKAREQLMALAARPDLFDEASFPLPTDTTDRTFLVHQTDGKLALYVCTSKPGLEYTAHDHGGSWAVIAAVSGAETHRFYSVVCGVPEVIDQVVCEPGTAVSMLPDGIHSIHAGNEPLLHLHLYGLAFENQTERREFDLETGEERRFHLENFTFIEDRR